VTETDAKSVEHARLARLLRPLVSGPVAPNVQARGIWDTLVTSFVPANAPRGDIGRFTDEDIAEGVGWQGKASDLVESLLKAGRLVAHPEHRLLVANWHRIAPAYLRSNVKHAGGFLTSNVVADRNDGRNEDRNGVPNEGGSDPHNDGVTPTVYSSLISPSLPSSPTSWGTAEREEVEEELLKCGVRYPDKAVARAIEHNCSPADVMAVIAFWRCMRPAWDAGALFDRVVSLRCNQDHSTLWPAPSAAYSKAKAARSSTKAVDEVTSDNASRRERLGVVADRFAELHRAHWMTIEALPAEELRGLWDDAFGLNSSFEWDLRAKRGMEISQPQQLALLNAFQRRLELQGSAA
jgi:hypothetical protein